MPDAQFMGSTMSLCRTCGRTVAAQIWIEDHAVWFRKHCPEHGPQRVRICGDVEQYLHLNRFHRAAAMPAQFATAADANCPDSCGLCPRHEQHVCMPIIEITDHCDMSCPICLVQTPGTFHLSCGQVERMLDQLIASEGQIDVLNLSGGEPTVNPDFRRIVEICVARKDVLYVSVSTNGRRLARDHDLLKFLSDHRVVISLQLDGLDDVCHRALRGREMLSEKLRLIQAAGECGARMSLTVTAARGVNEHALAGPVQMLFENAHILSVMIQPMAYVGRGAAIARPEDALTIPDVTRLLEDGCGGRVRADDFCPLPCSHPACFSLAFYLRTAQNEFMPVRRLLDTQRYLDLVQNRALPGADSDSFARIRDALYDLWSGPAALMPDSQKAMAAIRRLIDGINCRGGYCAHNAASVAERSVKTIFVHHFMDRDSFDLSRARKCCQVYPLADGRLMPACVYNCIKR